MKRAIQDIFVSVIGMVTSVLTAVILYLIEKYFEISLYTFMFWFVIPIGAIGAGFLAAGGYYLGARLFNHRPSRLILLNMVLISIGTFFLVHYLSYISLDIDGTPVSDYVSFGTYIDTITTHTSMTLRFKAVKVGETGELGNWGYLTTVLQIIGFAVGGVFVYTYLTSKPYCDKCSRYLKKTGQQDRFTSDGTNLIEQLKIFATFLENNSFSSAIRYHAKTMGVKYSSGHHLRTRVITSTCTGCNLNHLNFVASKLNGDNWTDINGTEIRIFTKEQLDIEKICNVAKEKA